MISAVRIDGTHERTAGARSRPRALHSDRQRRLPVVEKALPHAVEVRVDEREEVHPGVSAPSR
jgi:hypothetical protein